MPDPQPQEVYVDDESKLTLHGLVQHYIMLHEEEKNRKLTDLLDALDFNQVVIFVKNVARATELNRLLNECNFPSICIHSRMTQVRRMEGQDMVLGREGLIVAKLCCTVNSASHHSHLLIMLMHTLPFLAPYRRSA